MSVSERLEEAREILLDLSRGNRLLNYRILKAQGLDFVDAISADVYRRLVKEKPQKSLSFLPAPEDPSTETPLVDGGGHAVPTKANEPEGASAAPKASPKSLQTAYGKEVLAKRLLRSAYVYRNYMNEQGVNLLYMACGFLEWYEAEATDIHQHAPLILIPVSLERSSARAGFRVAFTGDEITRNRSLEAKLRELWGVEATRLPGIGDNPEGLDVDQYLDDVEQLVKGKKRWKVLRDKVAVGFFSFGKFLLYNDLDRDKWPNGEMPHTHHIIQAILGEEGLPQNAGDLHLDSESVPDWLTESDPGMHVVDADSSQVTALDLVRNGRSLIIKGPPGTGKSQTITNIIAQAIYDGKKVLFVSAKMAALDVVKRNLAKVGLDNACLELHSRKKARMLVVKDLKVTHGSEEPDAIINHTEELSRLQALARILNEHSKLANTPIEPSGVPLIDAYGELLRLREIEQGLGQEFRHVHDPVPALADWDHEESWTREKIVEEFRSRLGQMGAPNEHLFWPSKRTEFTPFLPGELRDLAEVTQKALEELTVDAANLADCLNMEIPDNLAIIEKYEADANYFIQAPDLAGLRIVSEDWLQSKDVIVGLIKTGGRYKSLRDKLREALTEDAFAVEVMLLREALEQLKKSAAEVAELLLLSHPDTVNNCSIVRSAAERILDPPSLEGIDTDNREWLLGSSKILSIIDSGRKITALRNENKSTLESNAWDCDLSQSAEILESQREKWWRHFNLKYRQAWDNIRELCTEEDDPYSVSDLLGLADVIGEVREHQAKLDRFSETASTLFGSRWRGRESEWDDLQEITKWLSELYRDCERGEHPGEIIAVLGTSRPDTLDDPLLVLAGAFENHDGIVESLNGLFLDTPPVSVQEQIDILVDLEELQGCRQALEDSDSLFGELIEDGDWLADEFRWDVFEQAANWLGELHASVTDGGYQRDHLTAISQPDFANSARKCLENLDAHRGEFLKKLSRLCGFVELEATDAFADGSELLETSWTGMKSRLQQWMQEPELLNEVVQYNLAVERLKENGLDWIATVASSWEYADRHLTDLLKHHRYTAIVERAYEIYADLSTFNGYQHNESIREFVDADRELLQATQAEIGWRHWGKFQSTIAEGEMGFLQKQFQKKAKTYLPVRTLMANGINAIQTMKPVFMMGPQSIPAFLPRRQDLFDLVVFDEASQVEPVDAFGAIVRGRQLVVVGDEDQLPPTRFFDKLADERDEDHVGDIESILGYCKVGGFSEVLLKWHYRSLHETLISVSNAEFYKRLVVFPSPNKQRGELGLHYRYLPDTVYETGKAINDREAEEVALAARSFAKEQLAKDKKDRYTLGVAAFGINQTEHIEDHIERLRQTDREFDKFCSQGGTEPFFVKNLENVQGDERDVIFISIGYGRQEDGKLSMNFGPLNKAGGERRLNVLITRARRKCVVFTNMKYTDIDLDRTESRGVKILQQYLQYAETGQLDIVSRTGEPGDSPFEDAVAVAIETKLGYKVVQQVNWQGDFGAIDIGVKDPDRPGAYILGIECDGATYHRSRAARDRDRLKEMVLKDRGWRIHRIWSTDWFNNPERELRKLRDLLDEIRSGKGDGLQSEEEAKEVQTDPGDRASSAEPDGETGSGSEAQTASGMPSGIVDYEMARGGWSGKKLSVMEPKEVGRKITRVVEIESPVHISEVRRRILTMVADTRSTSRFNVSFDKGLAHATTQELVVRFDDFLWRYDMAQSPLGMSPIRNRNGLPKTSRDIELIAPEEIKKAIFTLVQKTYGMKEGEIPRVVVRWLGFRATSGKMRKYVSKQVAALVDDGALIRDGELLRLPES